MAPQDTPLFTPVASRDWVQADALWFQQLAAVDLFSAAEKVHLARVALQQQWICDVQEGDGKRAALQTLGLHVATTEDGFLIVSGSQTLAEYINFRARQLSTIEAGVLYGYSPSAVVAFTGIIKTEPTQPWPETTGQYFLGGAFSAEFSARERALIDRQWEEIERHAPALAEHAHRAFAEALELRAA